MLGVLRTVSGPRHCMLRYLTLATAFETCGGESVLLLTHNPNPTPVDLPPSGGNSTGAWALAGCVKDGSARALTGYSFASDKMTPSLCQDGCSSKGFSMAGMEYGSECFCTYSFFSILYSLRRSHKALRWQRVLKQSRWIAVQRRLLDKLFWRRDTEVWRRLGPQSLQASGDICAHRTTQTTFALGPSITVQVVDDRLYHVHFLFPSALGFLCSA